MVVDSWQVTWTDSGGADRSREFGSFLEAWTFNEEFLKGKGEVMLITDRPVGRQAPSGSEAEAARKLEGGRRYARKRG